MLTSNRIAIASCHLHTPQVAGLEGRLWRALRTLSVVVTTLATACTSCRHACTQKRSVVIGWYVRQSQCDLRIHTLRTIPHREVELTIHGTESALQDNRYTLFICHSIRGIGCIVLLYFLRVYVCTCVCVCVRVCACV